MSVQVEFLMNFGEDNEINVVANVSPDIPARMNSIDNDFGSPAEGGEVEISMCHLTQGTYRGHTTMVPFEPTGLGVWNRHLNKYESLMDLIAEAAHEELGNE